MSKNPDEAQRERLKRLATLPDEQIDTVNIPEVADWSGAVRGLYRPRKQAITIRLDADILAYFRAQGRHYQTEINRALREWVQSHQKAS
jgi:uncharacterized protein (DUF4415 family)